MPASGYTTSCYRGIAAHICRARLIREYIAEQRGISVSEIVRRALDYYIDYVQVIKADEKPKGRSDASN